MIFMPARIKLIPIQAQNIAKSPAKMVTAWMVMGIGMAWLTGWDKLN